MSLEPIAIGASAIFLAAASAKPDPRPDPMPEPRPNPRPYPRPDGSFPGGPGDSSSGCFSLNEFVYSENGDEILLKDLELKTKVKSFHSVTGMNTISSEVIADLDSDFQRVCTFVHLKTSEELPLELTETHLILKKDRESGHIGYTFARNVQIGDSLKHFKAGWVEVQEISLVKRIGVSCPLTNNGTIVVNGFHCSCFARVKSHTLAALSLPVLIKTFDYFKTDYKEERNQGPHPVPQKIRAWTRGIFTDEN